MTISCTQRYRTAVKFTLEPAGQINLVRGYSAGELRINAERLQSCCIVTPQRLIRDFGAQRYGELTAAHLAEVFALAPELVIIGSGPQQQFAPRALREEFARRGIGLEVMQLGAACRTYNVLAQEGRRVAALLFLE
jgi:uncharacterized protein